MWIAIGCIGVAWAVAFACWSEAKYGQCNREHAKTPPIPSYYETL